MKFNPLVTKKEAYKNLTSSLVKCGKTGEKYIAITPLNRCFGFCGHSSDTTRNAVKSAKVNVVRHGNSCYVSKADAKKVIDFVYANKEK